MELEHHVGLYVTIGVILQTLSLFHLDQQELIDKVRRAGPRAVTAFVFGMMLGVIFWPFALIFIGLKLSKKARSACEMCGRQGSGKQCKDCKALVASEARRELARLQREMESLEDNGRRVASTGYAVAVPYVPVEPPPRHFVCEMPCPTCGGHAVLYANDYRCPGLFRVECDAGHFGDLGPESILIPEKHRRAAK